MNNRLARRFRVLAAVSALGLVSGMLTLAAAAPSRAATASFPLRNHNNPSMCLGISGGRHDASAILWKCNGHPDQQWRFGGSKSYDGYTWYQLINNDNQCLGVRSGRTFDGARIVGWNCTGHNDQYWYEATSIRVCGGYHPLINLNAFKQGDGSKVIGVKGGVMSKGTPIILYHYQAACNNQMWAG